MIGQLGSGLLAFGMTTILLAILLTLLWVKDTLPWAKLEASQAFYLTFSRNAAALPG